MMTVRLMCHPGVLWLLFGQSCRRQQYNCAAVFLVKFKFVFQDKSVQSARVSCSPCLGGAFWHHQVQYIEASLPCIMHRASEKCRCLACQMMALGTAR